MAAIDSTTTSPSADSTLPGLGRALVQAGKLESKTAAEIVRQAQAKRFSFIAELTGSGAVSAPICQHRPWR